MANRSTNIKGRVLRNLKRHGFNNSEVLDPEIYDELTQAQNQIISDVATDIKLTVTLEADLDSYPLSTDSGDNPSRRNIASIKILKLPSTWTNNFTVVSNLEFIEKVNASAYASASHPVIGTVIDNELQLYPTPTDTDDEQELEFYVYLSSATQDIDEETLPELPSMWDKCLEFYTTAQFLSGVEREQWLVEYEKEVKRLRPVTHRKHHNLQSQDVFGSTGGSQAFNPMYPPSGYGSGLFLGETQNTAYRGDRGKIAYDHSQLTSGNPHDVSKSDVGLGNVDNTSDLNKPISTLTQTALDTKVDKVTGKGLSTEDYTTIEKGKLAGIEENANNYTHPATHPATMITEDSTHRFMTDTERSKLAGIEDGAQVNDPNTCVLSHYLRIKLQNSDGVVDGTPIGFTGGNITIAFADGSYQISTTDDSFTDEMFGRVNDPYRVLEYKFETDTWYITPVDPTQKIMFELQKVDRT